MLNSILNSNVQDSNQEVGITYLILQSNDTFINKGNKMSLTTVLRVFLGFYSGLGVLWFHFFFNACNVEWGPKGLGRQRLRMEFGHHLLSFPRKDTPFGLELF